MHLSRITGQTGVTLKSEVEEKILGEALDVFDKWFEETLARNLAFPSGLPPKMIVVHGVI